MIYSVCVFVAYVIYEASIFFHITSQGARFSKKKLLNAKCVFWFSLQMCLKHFGKCSTITKPVHREPSCSMRTDGETRQSLFAILRTRLKIICPGEVTEKKKHNIAQVRTDRLILESWSPERAVGCRIRIPSRSDLWITRSIISLNDPSIINPWILR